MTQSETLLNYLRDHGRISLLACVKSLGIVNPAAVVSEIRKKHGTDAIRTDHVQVMNNSGTGMINLPEYTLTEIGRAKIWKERKPFPIWLSIVKQV